MDKSDYKQLVTEIKNISKRKEFKGFSKGFKTIEDVKDAYDYMLINVCKKYKMDTNIIVENMEAIWLIAKEDNINIDIKKISQYYGVGVGAAISVSIPIVTLGIAPILLTLIFIGKIPLNKILSMNKYMVDMQECIKEIAKKELENNG